RSCFSRCACLCRGSNTVVAGSPDPATWPDRRSPLLPQHMGCHRQKQGDLRSGAVSPSGDRDTTPVPPPLQVSPPFLTISLTITIDHPLFSQVPRWIMWSDHPETQDLLDQAREGQSAAVERLLDVHREPLRRMINMRLDPALAARV